MTSSTDADRIAESLRAQLGSGYPDLTERERERCLGLLRQVQQPQDVALAAEPGEEGGWTVTVCTADCLGVLSMIAGLLAAYRFDIVSADIYTLHLPQATAGGVLRRRAAGMRGRPARPTPAGPSHRVLDRFVLRSLGEQPPDVWQRFRDELRRLVALLSADRQADAVDEIADRVARSLEEQASPDAKLLPVAIEVSNDPDTSHTRLAIRSGDTPGFLFAFTNALAGVTVNIERAEVRTEQGEVRDTFWVTDLGGRPIRDPGRIHELRVATALLKQFTYLLPRSPNPGQALRQFNALLRQLLSRPEWTADVRDLESPQVLETLADLMGVSRFLWEDFLRLQHENLFPVLVDVPSLEQERSREQLAAELARRLDGAASDEERIAALNEFKDREMFRIDLRHITGRLAFEGFSRELSDLADVVAGRAGELAYDLLRRRYGEPLLASGERCPWCLAGLGKFGGAELGFGSDLELLFVYGGEGTTTGPERVRTSAFFEEFVRTFQSAVHSRQEGIFEIDLRLRPYGKAGSLATALGGMREYYTEGGFAQQFERMALVKLRPVAGDRALAEEVVAVRDAFVYSGKPLDPENVRHLRHRQATELVAPGKINAKYSAGGLVDIEYAVQARQIAAGAQDPRVRVTNSLAALERLREGGHLSGAEAARWRETYVFLRRLIDALRVVRGHAKDLTIPPAESREFAYLAQRLRYGSSRELADAIGEEMRFARGLWEG